MKKELPNLAENHDECCGCSACYSICPVGAIIMSGDNKEGFYYPVINEEKCIRCYKCLSACEFKKDIKTRKEK